MGKLINLVGKNFGRLEVISRNSMNDNYNKPRWNCICECGKETTITGASLRDGLTNSCGCLNREVAKITGKENIKYAIEANNFENHEDSNSYEHRVWLSMKSRIKNPHKKTYENLNLCEKWKNSYITFLNDMGRAPTNKHQIDRIDNSEGYYPENCRWVTPKENCRNKSTNVNISWKGETRCLYEWAEILCPKLGIKPDTLQYRIKKGWRVEDAFTTPKKKNQFS